MRCGRRSSHCCPAKHPSPGVADPAAMIAQRSAGIIFVLRSGIPWEMLPREMGGSGMTCWRRLRDWQAAGVRAGLHRVLPERLSDAGHLDWSRARLDRASVAAKRGVPRPARPRRIAGQTGRRKRHLVVDRRGPPLGLRLNPANRHDSLMRASTLDAVPGVRHGRGRPRRRPHKLHADKAYDHRRCRAECRARSVRPRIARPRSVRPRIARRGVDSSERRAHWPGSTASVAPPSATSGVPTSTKPS